MIPEVYHVYEEFHQINFITNHTYSIIILLEVSLLYTFVSPTKLKTNKQLSPNQKKLQHPGICIGT